MSQTGLPLASVPSLESSTEPSSVGGDAPSLTKIALTRLGAGSGTAIGSIPDSWLAWKISTRACALIRGMNPTPIGPRRPVSVALTSIILDTHGSSTGVSSVALCPG